MTNVISTRSTDGATSQETANKTIEAGTCQKGTAKGATPGHHSRAIGIGTVGSAAWVLWLVAVGSTTRKGRRYPNNFQEAPIQVH